MARSVRWLLLACILLCTAFPCVSRALTPNDMLESALSMLEDGNPFLERYNAETGRSVQARFEHGCPYFWGGRSEARLLTVMSAWKSSPGYYIKDQSYVYGFDCTGFVQWVLLQTGHQPLGAISDALALPVPSPLDIEGSGRATGADLSRLLRPGDVLAIHHHRNSYHVAMYIGTLREYGYTEKDVSAELLTLLDHPLIIHCTVSSDYYIRYEDYIEDTYEGAVYPPDGGVIVSVVAPRALAPYTEINPDNDHTSYFLLDDYQLQVYDLSADEQTRWLRWPQR